MSRTNDLDGDRANVFEARVFHRQPFGAGNELCTGENRNLRIADHDAFEIVVVSGLHIEQRVIAITFKNHFAIACLR